MIWQSFSGDSFTNATTEWLGKGRNSNISDKQVADSFTFNGVPEGRNNTHMYTIIWRTDYIQWLAHGQVVRTLYPTDINDGISWPQTPMQLSIRVCNAGRNPDCSFGTGLQTIDFTKGPYSAQILSVNVQDYTTNGTEYVYGDKTGDQRSIVVQNDTSNDGGGSSGVTTSAASTATVSPSLILYPTTTTTPSANSTVSSTSPPTVQDSTTNNTGIIVGSVVGGLAIVFAGIVAILLVLRSRRTNSAAPPEAEQNHSSGSWWGPLWAKEKDPVVETEDTKDAKSSHAPEADSPKSPVMLETQDNVHEVDVREEEAVKPRFELEGDEIQK